MLDFGEIAPRFANAFVTIALAILLFNIYKKGRKDFYLLWSLGYFFYGANILVRTFLPEGEIAPFILLTAGFTLILVGIGRLINRVKTMLILSASIPIAIIIVSITSVPDTFGWLISIIPYLLVGIGLLIIKNRHPVDLDLLIVGWMILLFVNLALAFNWMNAGYVEVMAIFAKIVIFYGMTTPHFSFLVDDLKRFLIIGMPTNYSNGHKYDSCLLVTSTRGQKQNEIKWIVERVNDNARRGVRSILVSTYDLISPTDMKIAGMEEDNIYLVRMVTGNRGAPKTFEQHVMTINDDLNQLDLLFTDIVNYSNERKISCEIIVYSISNLIHTHGWRRVYSFAISKIPQIKGSNVSLLCFYYPETHEDPTEASKFERLADRIISIR
ncbi:MAG: hypothetical protein NTV61_03290 [Candidatus Bathyarchaeota archaeon]|nr:hypothetical protein [Candidatus Bathyarchaeota archaeon]